MSESTEMYLVTIARLNEEGSNGPIPLSRLARDLQIAPVSVNQMVHKLQAEGLLAYTPYKGVQLTKAGQQQARQILRHHHLWEEFLIQHLGFSTAEADALACRFEHIFPIDTAERLADYLDKIDLPPGGESIQGRGITPVPIPMTTLSELNVGESARVTRTKADKTIAAFYESQGIFPGALITVMAIGSGGEVLVETSPGNHVNLSAELAQNIRMNREPA